MAFLNIVTLLPKIDEIRFSMFKKNIDLIAFNETRLDSNISDGVVNLNDYDIIRNDRLRNGGGACIYLRSSINYLIRNNLIPTDLEAVCIEIFKPHSKPFLVTTIYSPPNASLDSLPVLKILLKRLMMKIKNFISLVI